MANSRLAWTTAPMMSLLVDQNCRKFGLSGLSADTHTDSESEPPSLVEYGSMSNAREIATLFDLAGRLAPRFYSACDAWALSHDVDRILGLEAASASSERVQLALTMPDEWLVSDSLVANSGPSWSVLIKALDLAQKGMSDKDHNVT